ncbi:MAG TPA: GGDEF domain-containing protein [Methylophilaceae bacterium]|jgi:diguanylate cyclase (GGDEF)-like protein
MPEVVIENLTLEQEELRGCARTVAEIEWLLLILVLLYQTFGGTSGDDRTAIGMAIFLYAAFIMSFHYVNFYKVESRWKVALETWVMISFITWCLWFTGRLESPLVNTYLLVIITSSLTLGKVTTLAELCLIAACFLFLGNHSSIHDVLTLSYTGAILVQLAPIILVAYITSMFSSDIRYGLNKAKLVSETDELTKVFNRRGFTIAADRLFGQAKRYNRAMSVLVIDSDNLKQINDNHGHKFGDTLLLMIVKCIKDQLRDTDVLARFGGDEFVVLLPEAQSSGAQLVAERILHAVANSLINIDGTSVKGTVSIGLATFPDDGPSITSIVENADKAMYQAKSDGRNKVIKFAS